jgi:hypothetical protein
MHSAQDAETEEKKKKKEVYLYISLFGKICQTQPEKGDRRKQKKNKKNKQTNIQYIHTYI